MKVPFQSILCPTDLSEIGNLAVPVSYRLAAEGATVHLLHVCEPPFLGNPLYNQFVPGYVASADEQSAGEERVRNELHRLPPHDAIERGVRTEYLLVPSVDVADCIEAEARRIGADAIVMGTRGRTGLGRLVMGSVAMEIVHKERLPVLLVHEDMAHEAKESAED